jgi:hypothetical protein
MADKNIGFRRNIYLTWLDAAADVCRETDDPAAIRSRLEPIVGERVINADNRRVAVDILVNIWVKTSEVAPELRRAALRLLEGAAEHSDRLWLHYGLTLVYYPIFRECAAAIGQLTRFHDAVTPAMVKKRLVGERGQLGALEKAVERVVFSLRDWGILASTAKRYAYAPRRGALSANSDELEAWLLACALYAHPAHELPFADLVHLPELFPFRFTVGVDVLRGHPLYVVQRQGVGLDMMSLASPRGGVTVAAR